MTTLVSKEAIDGEIPVMPKFHNLELYDCVLTGKGLKAILDCCLVLETTLHMRWIRSSV
jgi:hypothetical protein